ncbi:MAG TPA: TetR/AcrR family transcriptional regulator [Solirubrobacteraceae bacterium]|jgi:AcrR family transcriptional regulator|nr:TetR/AcrR family transcriptional regulator [Solirubrobacteraceae bacterium]
MATSARRTQQERSEATRTALLDAAIDCLSEAGYAKVTTSMVCERAGLSRGAHLHHYGTRAALLAAAIGHLGDRLMADAEARLACLLPDGPRRTERALDVLWSAYRGELFLVALELGVAARTDPELMAELAPVEQMVDRRVRRHAELLFPHLADRPDFAQLVGFVLSTLRGLALLDVVRPSRGGQEQRWRYARAQLLGILGE